MFSNKIIYSLIFTVFQRPQKKKMEVQQKHYEMMITTSNAFFFFNVITCDSTQEIFDVCSTYAEYAEYMFKNMFAIKSRAPYATHKCHAGILYLSTEKLIEESNGILMLRRSTFYCTDFENYIGINLNAMVLAFRTST